MNPPRSACGAPPQGGATSGPAEPDPRLPLEGAGRFAAAGGGVRKVVLLSEQVFRERAVVLAVPARRVCVLAVLDNPCVDGASGEALAALAALVGASVMPEALSALGAPVVAYGKGALVGVDGCVEDAAWLLHPTLGRPMREAIGGGKALIPSTAKVGAMGAALDVPLGHRDEAWAFDAIDTLTASVADAPRPREIVLAIALAAAPRPNAQVGAAPATKEPAR